SAARYGELMETQGHARAGEERLSPSQRLNEYVLLGLRLREGFDAGVLSRHVGLDIWDVLGRELRVLTDDGVLYREGDAVILKPQWTPLADAVAARLLRDCG